MKKSLFFLIAAATIACAAPPAQAERTALKSGKHRAEKLGYNPEQASCYGAVFSRYATVGPRGYFTLAGKRSLRSPFYAEIWSQCGVY